MPVTSSPSTSTRPLARRVEAGHHAHQRRLAGLRRAEQHRDRAAAPASGRAGTARSAAPTRCSMRSSFSSMRAPSSGAALPSSASARRTSARPRRARPALRCRPSLLRRHSTSSALRAHSCVVQVVAARPRTGRAPPRRPSAVAGAEHALDARAVGARQAVQQRRRQLRDGAARAPATKRVEVGVGPLRRADPGRSGRRRAGGAPSVQAPRGARRAARASRSAASSASLRKVVILPPHTDSSGACVGVELEQVVARHGRRVARLVVEQRAHAGVASRPRRAGVTGLREIAARLLAQVGDLARRRCAPRRSRRGARRRWCRSA